MSIVSSIEAFLHFPPFIFPTGAFEVVTFLQVLIEGSLQPREDFLSIEQVIHDPIILFLFILFMPSVQSIIHILSLAFFGALVGLSIYSGTPKLFFLLLFESPAVFCPLLVLLSLNEQSVFHFNLILLHFLSLIDPLWVALSLHVLDLLKLGEVRDLLLHLLH